MILNCKIGGRLLFNRSRRDKCACIWKVNLMRKAFFCLPVDSLCLSLSCSLALLLLLSLCFAVIIVCLADCPLSIMNNEWVIYTAWRCVTITWCGGVCTRVFTIFYICGYQTMKLKTSRSSLSLSSSLIDVYWPIGSDCKRTRTTHTHWINGAWYDHYIDAIVIVYNTHTHATWSDYTPASDVQSVSI